MTATSIAATRPDGPSQILFRVVILLFALLMGAQCIWLLLPELSRPEIKAFPVDAATARAAAKQRDPALWAASIAAIRGELWAESAVTYADLLFPNDQHLNQASASVAQARKSLAHAIDQAPTQSGAWLLEAGLALRYPAENVDPVEALKMSFYTGPSEQTIIPLRLWLATQLNKLDDVEIHEFIARDIRLLLAKKQHVAIANAYSVASPVGRRLIEQTVGDLDPAELSALHAQDAQNKNIPN